MKKHFHKSDIQLVKSYMESINSYKEKKIYLLKRVD